MSELDTLTLYQTTKILSRPKAFTYDVSNITGIMRLDFKEKKKKKLWETRENAGF